MSIKPQRPVRYVRFLGVPVVFYWRPPLGGVLVLRRCFVVCVRAWWCYLCYACF